MKNALIHAANGITHAFRDEVNIRIQVGVMILVVILSILFCISAVEWLFVTGCSMLVLSMELINTAIENVCDLVSKEYHPLIKVIKDVAAGAVLISCIGSAVTGGIIFLPKIYLLIKQIV